MKSAHIAGQAYTLAFAIKQHKRRPVRYPKGTSFGRTTRTERDNKPNSYACQKVGVKIGYSARIESAGTAPPVAKRALKLMLPATVRVKGAVSRCIESE